jgi:hypothetical protein
MPEPHPDTSLSANADALLAELRREAHRDIALHKVIKPVFGAFFLTSLPWFACHLLLGDHNPITNLLFHAYEILGLILLCWGLPCLYLHARWSKQRLFLLTKLRNDLRVIGTLVLLTRQDMIQVPPIAAIACLALTELLPQLQTSDADRFSPEQMEGLLWLLRHFPAYHYHQKQSLIKLRLAILKALEQIGDQRAIEPVTRLTAHKDPQIREAAQECLSFLQARTTEQQHAMTLLRPSDAMSATPEMLLRPAAAGDSGKSQEQLLRSVE